MYIIKIHVKGTITYFFNYNHSSYTEAIQLEVSTNFDDQEAYTLSHNPSEAIIKKSQSEVK